ncbi:hypothetical protein I4U23_003713 [Adineta vaga]|nr:hypothetical protein I4U23_003713 [Adineta vaga]
MYQLPVFSHVIDDLTPESLSQMLSKSSNVPAQVISYMTERIGEGKGWGGPIYRLHNIQYLSPLDSNLPQSIVLKLSTGTWNGRIASIEPEFYLNLAPHISHVQIPRFYYAARNADNSNETLLLLEDLSINYKTLGHAHQINDTTLYSLTATIATLHAEFFERPLLLSNAFTWLPSLNSTLSYYQTKYLQQINTNKYQEFFESNLSSEALIYVNTLSTQMPYLFEKLSSERYTLSHGDFYINNVLIQKDEPHRFVLLDWQTCCRANGLLDIVYLLRLLQNRRVSSLEQQILQIYHQTLTKYGISQYSLSEICHDYYSLALPFLFIFFVCWDVPKRNKLQKAMFMLEDILKQKRR